jgi:hypothetical protein
MCYDDAEIGRRVPEGGEMRVALFIVRAVTLDEFQLEWLRFSALKLSAGNVR